ncbi:MAG: sodium/glutamate symporter [Synergistes sp.]|nr:sodium/glutamate symporter [Synergistes sp.]
MTLWTVFTDVCLMGVLLLVGQILRAKLKIFQKLLIPPALIAGFIGLVLGPKGYAILPLSKWIGVYAGVLIVVVFAAMPIGDRPTKEQLSGQAIGGFFLNNTGIIILQYAVGMLVCTYFLNKIFNLNPGFGLMMATGFYGGHGTAAAVGSAYAALGWADAADLGMTTATAGIVGGIVFGMILINIGVRRGWTHYVEKPSDLPPELRTGLIPPEKQKQGGKITVSSISVDPMAFHISVVALASILGYYTTELISAYYPKIGIPAYCVSILWVFVINKVLNVTGTIEYIDRQSINRISGTCTDFLIISGIASINTKIVLLYWQPLLFVCALGFVATFIWFFYVGGKCSPYDWFERDMMNFGHATGVTATGILLQRVVDPDMKSRGMEDDAIQFIFNRPIHIALQVLPPILLTNAPLFWSHALCWILVASLIVLLGVSYVLKWWRPYEPLKRYR